MQPPRLRRHGWPVPRGTPLDEVILDLRHIRSAVIVAIAALRRQNCELDEDIAGVLQRCVCARIEDQLEKLEAVRITGRPGRQGRPPAPLAPGGIVSQEGLARPARLIPL